ncbi:uncharacterized protein LOC141679483 [Apium graveolens]|uniref:uncharacterized protein LOC141679483 n=1 Tax=Apium graveolens TaxID=4045 RepID=UPI003D7B39AB
MNFATWNVRGINKAPHQKELQNFIFVNKIDFMGVLETKVKVTNALGISKKINKNWRWLFNYDYHYNGRIWVGWNPNVWEISLYSQSSQFITCNARLIEKNLNIIVTFVYAFNDAIDRVPLWDYILSTSNSPTPWAFLGDFNCITSLNEVLGGREHWTPAMQSFKDCLFNSGLEPMRTIGDIFTWFNKRSHDPVYKRLDRMVVNSAWFNIYTEGNVFVKHRGIMDHNPLLFEEPIQLQNFVQDSSTLSYCFVNLIRIHSNVQTARVNLEHLQASLSSSVDSDKFNEEKNLISNLNLALAQEESLLKQKARVKWLQLGDNNNSFFHQKFKVNWNQGKILSLQNTDGNLVYGQEPCASVAVQYFTQLLGAPANSDSIDLSSVNCKEISDAQSRLLVASVTDTIIFDTIKSMKKNKAPGSDGVNAEFFLATWHITGTSFCAAVRYFFDHGSMPSGVNSTFITLIPKVVAPTRMQDFRPISLCSVLYKCISKILSSRLKKIMPALVDISQSAFIPGRSISDNILLSRELFRGYERETGVPKCALKIDLYKAFDSIHWNFIIAVLERMRFPGVMIGWIKACICSTRFSIKLNGIVHGYFKGTTGLRQGDPMSPYIFALCMNILSCILNNTPANFKYHWRCKELKIDHLFFADDVLCFSHGSKQSVQHILNSINSFSGWSGLAPSISKSTGFLCNCDDGFSTWFNILSIPRGTFPVRFFGVPLISSQLCVNDWMPIIDRITSRLHSWATLLLSLAGRVMLIRSVVHAIEAFWGNHFLLPASIHHTIQSMLTRFLWKGNINHKGGAKIAWTSICLPREEGGLDLKNMIDWNHAQVIHHLIKVVTKSCSLWARWVNATVLNNKSFWTLKIPTDCSWIWRKVLKLRRVALQFITYSIGSRNDISLWFDPWWGGVCLADSYTSTIISQCGLHHSAMLSSVIHLGAWRLPRPNSRHHHLDPLLFHWLEISITHPLLLMGQILCFGMASMQSRLRLGILGILSETWVSLCCGLVWHRLRVARYAHHQWLICHGRLNTLSRLHRFGIVDSQQCFLCIGGRETISHLFVHCTYSKWILSRILAMLGLSIAGDTWLSLLNSLIDLQDSSRSVLALCMVQIFFYHIWRERNTRAHNKGVFGPAKLLHGILVDLVARLQSSVWFNNLACNRPDLHSCISCIAL